MDRRHRRRLYIPQQPRRFRPSRRTCHQPIPTSPWSPPSRRPRNPRLPRGALITLLASSADRTDAPADRRELTLQKCHTARISGVDDCRRNARALAFLAVTVCPHGRGECSCEREPRPSDHPRPELLFGPLTASAPPFDRLSGPHRPTTRPPAANSFQPILNLGAPSAD